MASRPLLLAGSLLLLAGCEPARRWALRVDTTLGRMTIYVRGDAAPEASERLRTLVDEGWYDGLPGTAPETSTYLGYSGPSAVAGAVQIGVDDRAERIYLGPYDDVGGVKSTSLGPARLPESPLDLRRFSVGFAPTTEDPTKVDGALFVQVADPTAEDADTAAPVTGGVIFGEIMQDFGAIDAIAGMGGTSTGDLQLTGVVVVETLPVE